MFTRRRRSNEDFAEEIRAHIELEAERLAAEGMAAEDALAAATRRFGNTLSAQERFHESRRWTWWDELAADLRHASRSLARYPFSCLVAVVSLAAGIGAGTATLIVRHVVFLSPPPLYAEPDQLSVVGMGVPDRYPAPVPVPLFTLWDRDAHLASQLAAARASRTADARVGDRVETMAVRPVSPNLFSVLGVSAALGRTFDAATVDEAGPAPVVLSDRVWRNVFEGRQDAIGRVLWLDNVPHTVIGIMPEFFWFQSMDTPVWTLLDVRALVPADTVSVVARREPGVTAVELEERLQGAVAVHTAGLQDKPRQPLRAVVTGIEGTPFGRAIGPMMLVLLAASVVLTLLIACTNVAMLMIAQWTTREHEIAIRLSLGASRLRIVRALVAESVLIAVAGGMLGTCVTLALLGFLRGGGEAPHFNLSIDYGIFVTTALVTLFAGVLTGLAPALYETRRLHVNPMTHMRLSDGLRQRWRHALVVFEIAVTVALLVVAGAVISAAQRTMSTQPGFDTHPIAGVRVDSAAGISLSGAFERLAGLPGVTSVVAASNVPIVTPPPNQPVALDAAGLAEMRAERTLISPRFFETLGVPLRAGRPFTDQDDARGARVAIVNTQLAERLWPGRSPLGEYVWSGNVPHQVVGLVAGYGNTALRAPRPAFYLPMAQTADVTRIFFIVRSTSDLTRRDWRYEGAMEGTLRREMRAVIPAGATVGSTFTLEGILEIGRRELVAGAIPMAPLIATGLLLTAAGIFSVLAFSIARRANELAVRIAIGANRSDLLRLVALQSARLVGMGMLLGIAATFAVTRVAQGTGSVFDSPGWQAFVIPMSIVALVGVLATWLPLRRVSRIDPAILLRST